MTGAPNGGHHQVRRGAAHPFFLPPLLEAGLADRLLGAGAVEGLVECYHYQQQY